MKRFAIFVLTMLALPATAAWAQNATPAPPAKSEPRAMSFGDLKPTPDMWFYEQEVRQYQDPKLAVRRNAEVRADQRQRRLAAMAWFGM